MELLHKWIVLILQAKFRFMGCLVKANAPVSKNRLAGVQVKLRFGSFNKEPRDLEIKWLSFRVFFNSLKLFYIYKNYRVFF